MTLNGSALFDGVVNDAWFDAVAFLGTDTLLGTKVGVALLMTAVEEGWGRIVVDAR